MSLTSPVFLIFFLPFCLMLYLNIKDKYKNILLLIFSLVFYYWCGIKFLILILLSSTIAYLTAYIINKLNNTFLKRLIVILSILYSVLVLIYYKYILSLSFCTDILPSILKHDCSTASIALPLGISFYTFSIISYILDIYWEKCKFDKNIINTYLYILFFPKITQGPIMRYSDFMEQINNKIDTCNLLSGFERLSIGVCKKIIIADKLVPVVNYSFSHVNEIGTFSAWIGIIAYLIQLYFDFSGYCDIAIGVGNIFGFKIPENFNYPYTSDSVAQYWRKWHITLGAWFRDYVYMPIFRYFSNINIYFIKNNLFLCDIIALLVVWILMGIWHGNGVKFLIYGLWWFVFIVYERIRDNYRKNARKKKGQTLKQKTVFEKIIDFIEVFAAIVFGQVIFRASTLKEAIEYFKDMVSFNMKDGIYIISFFDNEVILAFIAGIIFCFPVYKYIKRFFDKTCFRKVIYYTLLFVILFISFCYVITQGYSAFLYEIY